MNSKPQLRLSLHTEKQPQFPHSLADFLSLTVLSLSLQNPRFVLCEVIFFRTRETESKNLSNLVPRKLLLLFFIFFCFQLVFILFNFLLRFQLAIGELHVTSVRSSRGSGRAGLTGEPITQVFGEFEDEKGWVCPKGLQKLSIPVVPFVGLFVMRFSEKTKGAYRCHCHLVPISVTCGHACVFLREWRLYQLKTFVTYILFSSVHKNIYIPNNKRIQNCFHTHIYIYIISIYFLKLKTKNTPKHINEHTQNSSTIGFKSMNGHQVLTQVLNIIFIFLFNNVDVNSQVII